MHDIQAKIIELETQSHIIKLTSDFVKNPANKYSPMPNIMGQDGDKNSPIQAYNQILTDRARIIQNSNETNPLVPPMTLQADRLRESVNLSIANLEKATRQSISEMKNKEKLALDNMRRFPNKERDYIELKRRHEITQGIYLVLLQKKEETALNCGLNNERGKVVDAPYVKKKPVAPRKLFAAIGIMLFTIIIPVAWLFISEQTISLFKEYKNREKE
jgi:uncharacterized protein involved in exopolysaccharide biosynthesis